MNSYLLLLFTLAISTTLSAKQLMEADTLTSIERTDSVNTTDADGLKQGLWVSQVDYIGNCTMETHTWYRWYRNDSLLISIHWLQDSNACYPPVPNTVTFVKHQQDSVQLLYTVSSPGNPENYLHSIVKDSSDSTNFIRPGYLSLPAYLSGQFLLSDPFSGIIDPLIFEFMRENEPEVETLNAFHFRNVLLRGTYFLMPLGGDHWEEKQF